MRRRRLRLAAVSVSALVATGVWADDVMSRLGLARKYQPYAADAHTALLLHFDGDARDASPRAHACRVRGAGWRSQDHDVVPTTWREHGVFGQAARLDGNQDMTVEGIQGGALAEGFTAEAWVLIDRPATQREYRLLERRNSFDWRIRTYPDGYAKLLLTVWTDKGTFKAKSRECLPYGVWLHVSGTYDPRDKAASSGQRRRPDQARPAGRSAYGAQAGPLALYVHGSTIDKLGGYERQEKPLGRLSEGTGPVRVAAGFTGAVDELRLSGTPRSPAELVAPWLSGRWGDFSFTPPDVTVPRPRDWNDKALRLTRAQGVATFEALGLYVAYEGDVNADGTCRVRVRPRGERVWRQGMDLVRDSETHEFRGSVLLLRPGTTYEIELWSEDPDAGPEGLPPPLRFTKRTWDEEVPVGEVRRFPAGVSTDPVVINAQGRADAWIMYTSAEDAASTVDAGTRARDAVRIERAAFVILQGVTVRGGTKQAVRVVDSHHIRIRRCEMTGWGTAGTRGPDGRFVDERGRLINYHAGVYVAAQCRQVVVEHNYIHTPRGTANSWRFGHPVGPQGIVLAHTAGNNVIRHNDIVGSETHWWNDAIESIPNGAVPGGPYRDTDIYGNVLAFSNDDGTELDGGQINVRYWNNWIDKALCGVSCAPNRMGPSYVFRNLIAGLGEERDRAGSAFKMGGGVRWSPGVSVILHNTIYGKGGGLCSVGFGSEKDRGGYVTFSRNNLFAGPGRRDVTNISKDPRNDFDYDLIGRGGVRLPPGNEEHAVTEPPRFVDASAGDFRLTANSSGIDRGERLPGVNDDFLGVAPDMGAFEFGRDATAVFPARPSGMWALPLRVRPERVPGRDARAEIRLFVPPAAGSRWKAHPNSPWLRCVPSEGSARPVPQRLAVTFAREGPDIRLHRCAVTFRTDAGFNRTVMVDVKVYPSRLVAMAFEAEEGKVTGGLQKVRDPTASGGAYLHTPEGAEGGSVEFSFEVPEEGIYYIAARCMVPGPNPGVHDSFLASVDGAKRRIWDVSGCGVDRWNWVLVNARKEESPCRWRLSEGPHRLVIYSRERLARLDRLAITNSPYAEEPRGEGD